MSRGVMRIENALAGQHRQSAEPPCLEDWSGLPERVQSYAEKARHYFANVGAVGIEDRSSATEIWWVIWCFHVVEGRREYIVINDKSRKRREEDSPRVSVI